MAADSDTTEVAALRARVAELEAQLVETQRTTAALVARTQDRVYWLDRWHLDLDALMRRPGVLPALRALKAARSVQWAVKRQMRRWRGVA
jgi:hypothetical protein